MEIRVKGSPARQRPGLRQSSGALDSWAITKAVEGHRSPGRCRAGASALRFTSSRSFRVFPDALRNSTAILFSAGLCLWFAAATTVHAQRQLEKLGRGVIAIRAGTNSVYVGWRLWGTDPDNIGFNLYRVAGGTTNLLNGAPITNSCNFVDATANLSGTNSYRPAGTQRHRAIVKRCLSSACRRSRSTVSLDPAHASTRRHRAGRFRWQRSRRAYTYNANDCSAGDVDGDGEYEIILKWDPIQFARQLAKRLHRRHLPGLLQAGRNKALAH